MPVEVVGAAEAAHAIDAWVGRLDDAVTLEARHAADRLVSLVVPRVPKWSGRLAGSLDARPVGDEAAAAYDGSAPYAGYIEFGGYHGRPYVSGGRYLYPTATSTAAAFVTALERVTEREIVSYPWPTT